MLLTVLAVVVPLVLASPHTTRQRLVMSSAATGIHISAAPTRLPRRAPLTSKFACSLNSALCQDHVMPVQQSYNATVNVVDFGADPTGLKDSSDAFDAAMKAALQHNASGQKMADGIINLGGVTVHLQGGSFALSRPVVIPGFFGNIRISSGSLKALPSFPTDRFVIEAGEDADTCKKQNQQKSCNENLGFDDLFIDGSNRARGCLQINSTMGANVGPDMFFMGFNESGLQVNGGHEVMLHEAWFGTYYYGPRPSVSGTTAIEFFGNDHVVSDVIVFGAEIGCRVTGGANVIEGLHTWNDGTLKGGHGIIIEAQSTRLDMVYLDFTALVLVDPSHVTVTNSFFLGMGTVVLAAGELGQVDGLALIGNTYNNFNMPHNSTIVLDERNNTFKSCKNLVQVANFAPEAVFTTRAVACRKQLKSSGNRFVFDFSDCLLFPHLKITDVSYSVTIEGTGFVQHTARPPSNHTVVVDLSEEVQATVSVSVTQGEFSNGNSPLLR